MRASIWVLGVIAGSMLVVAPPKAAAQSPGEAVYNQSCAACHDHPEATRAPSKANLSAMRPQVIDYALTQGKMKAQGEGLAGDARQALIEYLTGANRVAAKDWTPQMACKGRGGVDLAGGPTITGFGYDRANTRKLTAKQAGLTTAQLSNMELAWAMAFPGASVMRAQPAVIGKTLFLPVADASAVYALDLSNPDRPCVRWSYKTPSGIALRTSAAYGVRADGKPVIVVSAIDTTVYMLDAKTGALLWNKKVGSYQWSMTSGTPTVLKDRVIVPVSQFEISVAASTSQVCCNNHGYILSLDPRDGSQQWRYDTMPEAGPVRDRGDGKMLYGPSGAPIWNSPTVDEKRRLIFFGTGEANSPPVSPNTDALIAIGLDDGKERWSMQATTRDIFLSGCGQNPKTEQLNCVRDTVYRDVDFGASVVRARLSHGTDIVLGGQKSGTLWALEPSTGKLLWRTHLGTGGALGGIHWGIAYDDDTVYAPVSFVGRNLPGEPVDVSKYNSGIYAIDALTGAVKWSYASKPDCTGDRPQRLPTCQRHAGFSTAASVIDGAVVAAGLDGWLYVFDKENGNLLWRYDTAQTYHGVNGVDGKGGSIDAASISAGNGLLLVNSGYGLFGQQPGNVLLAFKPARAARPRGSDIAHSK
jgi:polyvinyl alcohol dehydrogenase (cytochrome)